MFANKATYFDVCYVEREYSVAFCWQECPLTVTQEPLVFTTPCSAAILPPQLFWMYVFVMCVQQKPTLCEVSVTLHGTNPLVLTAFNNPPIIASPRTYFISRLLNPQVWP